MLLPNISGTYYRDPHPYTSLDHAEAPEGFGDRHALLQVLPDEVLSAHLLLRPPDRFLSHFAGHRRTAETGLREQRPNLRRHRLVAISHAVQHVGDDRRVQPVQPLDQRAAACIGRGRSSILLLLWQLCSLTPGGSDRKASAPPSPTACSGRGTRSLPGRGCPSRPNRARPAPPGTRAGSLASPGERAAPGC